MTSSFRGASYKQTTKEIVFLKELPKVLLSFSVKTFQGSRYKFFKQLMTSSFRGVTCTKLSTTKTTTEI